VLIILALVVSCLFVTVAFAMLYYLWVDAPDFPSIPDNLVYWTAFGILLAITGYWWWSKSGYHIEVMAGARQDQRDREQVVRLRTERRDVPRPLLREHARRLRRAPEPPGHPRR
jgi:hypothetical protein